MTLNVTLDTLGLPGDTPLLHNIVLAIQPGTVHTLMGPSGCGKTTALKTIAGLITPQSGQIDLFGDIVFSKQLFEQSASDLLTDSANTINRPAEERSIGFIFQDYALFPHMTISQNIAYGLSDLSKKEKQQRITETLKLVELPDMLQRYPHELSGGQQQRVAVHGCVHRCTSTSRCAGWCRCSHR